MPIYHIVALPQDKQKTQLNQLKNRLYTWWYRYSNKPNSSDVHVSLIQVSFEDEWMINILKNQILNLSKIYKRFSLPYTEITDKINNKTENAELSKNYQNWRWWVSMLFENKDNQLWIITQECIKICDKLWINDINSYIENIKTVKPKSKWTDNVLDYTANHMNICNYALPQKTKEAKTIVEEQAPKEIIFDTLALRNRDGKYEFEIKLNE